MNPIDRLTELFEKFPGIGPRQARRFVQYLLSEHNNYRYQLSDAIKFLGSQTGQCKQCFRWFVKNNDKTNLCSICGNPSRIKSLLFIVEKDADIDNVERSGYLGLYFVLGGTIPLATEEPERFVRLRQLVAHIESSAFELGLSEVILGLSATTEGDHTRIILQEKLLPVAEGLNFTVSSLGRGLSTGSELEYADPDTISSALQSRG